MNYRQLDEYSKIQDLLVRDVFQRILPFYWITGYQYFYSMLGTYGSYPSLFSVFISASGSLLFGEGSRESGVDNLFAV